MSNLSTYQEYIHASRYARWLPEKNRRENWEETVNRYFDFFETNLKEKYSFNLNDVKSILRDSVYNMEVMPSMRALMTAGPALKRDNICAYNCAFTAIETPNDFDEILYILMNGTGVGFSVESKYVKKLPTVPDELYPTDTVIVVHDSKLGWAKALRELITLLYAGRIPKWDVSKVRPAGAVLKTFGGRASGPEPLVALFNFCVTTFTKASGRKLSTLECHDIVCKIAEIVVVGGVRRSALISLSDINDDKMRVAKSGAWWENDKQRALANNSYIIEDDMDMGTFMKEWLSLYESKSGERGIFSRKASRNQAAKYGFRDPNFDFGTNPCSEIILRSKQFCNLTEVVVRENDTLETLLVKVKNATILGVLQSSLTDFKYLSSKWKKNCEEERLLGVSLTGIMDNEILSGKLGKDKLIETLTKMREYSREIATEWAQKLGINVSTAITCVKPSGTVSQLVDSASGIHDRWNEYYIRTVRADKKDPLSKLMIDAGVPVESDVMKPDSTWVFSFPMKAPKNASFRKDRTAIEQLELWKLYQDHWCEHKPSVTIFVKENEWMAVGSWVYENIDSISGVSFLPHSDHVYQQAPYQDIDAQTYNEWLAKMPTKIDWEKLSQIEKDDNTTSSQELACVAGGCEI